ncbi:MAG: flagellar accessory protein FlaH [Euryarchaeota archaeon]|nr:flagellar accessory protein FlaH [Euryarchaeota archaeon]MCG2728266.1 flagellar accessory protein FlaH [Candidatus Methanoperedenaceae archaeon]
MTDNETTKKIRSEKILSSGSGEIDRKLGGGMPLGSLCMIEGDNDTGKSVLIQQIMWGGLNQGLSITCYTTENTVKSLIKQMESLSLDISEYFVVGRLKIFPIHSEGMKWANAKDILNTMLVSMEKSKADVVMVDSLTVFVSHSNQNDVFDFFSACKHLCDKGKTILISAHRYAFDEETLIRIRSICDGHLELRMNEVGDMLIRTIRVAKIRGAQRSTGNIVSFEVVPEFGLRIIPLTMARV